VTGRKIFTIPGVLALVSAATIGVGFTFTSAGANSNQDPDYPPTTIHHGLHCGSENGSPRGGHNDQVTVSVSGYVGGLTITSDEAGTKTSGTHFQDNLLAFQVSINAGERTGNYTFTITDHNHDSCKVDYKSR
jgi:hypothetical protein